MGFGGWGFFGDEKAIISHEPPIISLDRVLGKTFVKMASINHYCAFFLDGNRD